MVFSKNEIILLSGGKKHIVLETLVYENKYYYYICEVNEEETDLIKSFKIITTVSENNCLFVKSIKGDLENKLAALFKEKLNNI